MHAVPSSTRSIKRILTLSAILLLAACGSAGDFRKANRLFEEGDYVESVRKYQLASDAAPNNVGYRQRYLLKKQEALNLIFADAEKQMASGDSAKAEGLYQIALQIDPQNAAAQEALRRLAARRRHSEKMVEVDALIESGALQEAERMAREVLAEAPGNPRAINSLDRIRLALSEKKRAPDGLDAKFKKLITLEFRDVPAKVVFEVLSKASGINFIYDQDIRPDLKVSVFLRQTPMDEAIRMIGLSTQLETRVINQNSMLVFPSIAQKISDYRQLSVRSFYLANTDAKKMAETLKAILKTENVVVDEKLNLLIMRDSPEAILLAEKLVALQDVGEPEVMLDVEILEIKRSTLLDMGISLPKEIGVTLNAPGQTSNLIPVDTLRGLNSSSIYASIPNASVKLNDERSDARILANPKIRVKSKEKAKVLIGDKVPVITSTSTSTGFVSETVNYVDVGLKLEVEPSVFSSDEVSIKINLEVSNLVREILTKSGTLSYQIGTRNAETTLRLKDGETQVLAGLINREDRRVASGWPGISRFPILNRIFGSQKTDKQNTEIVLSITPRLVRGVRRASLDELQFESGTATRLGGNINMTSSAPLAPDTAAGEANASVAADAGSAASVIPVPEPQIAAGELPNGPQVLLNWSVPAEVRAGEQFTAVLNISALQAVDQMPVMIGFDPQLLQVVNVEEGPFMAQGGGQSSLTKQVNLSDGKIIATVVRQGSAVSGQGNLLQVTFKALASTEATEIKLLSAEPSPKVGEARLANATLRIR
ncbi:secretin N-terminal domain-containing protein [Pseudoxanthomonas sacheonensis]|uniref:General secretion pathway protein D n=1 Tax=Pseudoxanthomonas sacheonensis TaxID=443615 RepID=A0ABU1RQT4_9GAMM|nr:secretin N-terminal domain-containing protein [Pseudoxanthomonas sacheonensis]MDR6841133.1 general secretion pathway protein D [Pseudoxanthomonas sacheonensis]